MLQNKSPNADKTKSIGPLTEIVLLIIGDDHERPSPPCFPVHLLQ
jgi:hypothetical protein